MNVFTNCIFENTALAPEGNRITGVMDVRAYWEQFCPCPPLAGVVEDRGWTSAGGGGRRPRWIFPAGGAIIPRQLLDTVNTNLNIYSNKLDEYLSFGQFILSSNI